VAPEFLAIAELLADSLRQATSYPFPVKVLGNPSETSKHTISLRLEPGPATNPESYRLISSSESVEIFASHAAGAFYGVQTLLQLLPPAIFGQAPRHAIVWSLPAVEIDDAPRFSWRGIMLDSARYFQPVAYIKRFIDLLAQHKFNKFHWHLTDDQGWRIEIKKYPRLTEIGARRKETMRGHYHAQAGGDGTPHAGFYSQDEIREIVAYASTRQIEIIPEIEMPGHAQAAVAAYPELGMIADSVEVSSEWGVHETLFNLKPATFEFLQDVLTEVLSLFPSPYIHIGGDEAVKNQWEGNREIQEHMAAVNVHTMDELQSWFIRQISDFVTKAGRRIIGWDEILEGGLAPGAMVMSWRGEEGGIAAAKMGHDVIMCPRVPTYFDYYQSEALSEEPLCIGNTVTLKQVYDYDPVPGMLTPEEASHVIGVQGQLWTEYIASTSRLEYMAFPRACALAEVAWSPQGTLNYENFQKRLAKHLRRLDCQDVRYRAPMEAV